MSQRAYRLISVILAVLLIANVLSVTANLIPITPVKAVTTESEEVKVLIVNIERVLDFINYRIILLENEGYTVPQEIKDIVKEISDLLTEVKKKYDQGAYEEAKSIALTALEKSYEIIEKLPVPKAYQEYIEKVIVKSDVESMLNLINILNKTIIEASDYVENKTIIANLVKALNRVKEILMKAKHVADKEPSKAREIVFTALLNITQAQWAIRNIAEEVGVKKVIR